MLSLEEEFAALEYTLQYVDKSAELVADLFTDYNYLPTASPNVALVHYNCNANVSLPPLCANSTILLLFFIALCEVSESRTYELMFNLFAVVMISTDVLPISPRGKLVLVNDFYRNLLPGNYTPRLIVFSNIDTCDTNYRLKIDQR